MDNKINKVAVIGSGTMGSQIALHFANTGVKVLLLDILPKELTEEEKQKGLSMEDAEVRNRIARTSLAKALKMNPSPVFKKEKKDLVSVGNLKDDLEGLADCDWVLEAIVEKLDIKRDLFAKIDRIRKKGSIISSNTSGISLEAMAEGRSEEFQAHFLGTHFFNPPRYLQLLELIPTRQTSKQVIDIVSEFGDVRLGKTVVKAWDTPAFIGNRIGIYATMLTIQLMQEMEMTIEEVDTLTGRVMGRPKSATFRTADMVGLDILADVAKGVYDRCPDDEEREIFNLPSWIQAMIDKGHLGAKTDDTGFYKKEKVKGDTEILTLDWKTGEYRKKDEPKFKIVEKVKKEEGTEAKIKSFVKGSSDQEVSFLHKVNYAVFGDDDDKAVEFVRRFFMRLFSYCSNRIPEITHDLYKIDEAIKAGYGWDLGPFELWDALRVRPTVDRMVQKHMPPADWVYTLIQKGNANFYEMEDGYRRFYDQQNGSMQEVPGSKELIILDNYRGAHIIWKNDGLNIFDIGDGVLCLDFASKRNTLDMEVIAGINHAIDLAEEGKEYKAIVIGNDDGDFSLGADLQMIGMGAFKGKTDMVRDAVKQFQDTMMRIRYCKVPVVAAPKGKTLGGGTELCMHSDAVQAAAETYMGLVEVAVGLIPGGGGTKEFAQRASQQYEKDAIKIPYLQERLMTIGQAKVSKSAVEAFELGYLREETDAITMNRKRVLKEAKEKALDLANAGYMPPQPQMVTVLGRNALSFFHTAIGNMRFGHYISDYDVEITRKLAYVLCGGALSGEQEVSEQYLLDLERDAFMELVTNTKSLMRMKHMMETGKPLRN